MSDWPEERVARLRELWADTEKSAAQIGEIMGVTRSAILGKAHRLRLEPRPPGFRPRNFSARPKERAPRLAAPPRAPFDPNRADRLLRKFSWEEA